MSVSAERLLNALWKEPELLREALSFLSVERIALPWVYSIPQRWERRSLCGTRVARCFTQGHPSQRDTSMVVAEARCIGHKVSIVVPSDDTPRQNSLLQRCREEVDQQLREAKWMLLDFPAVGPWVEDARGGWTRKDAAGGTVGRVRHGDAPWKFSLYVVLDEVESPFDGTLREARDTVDQQLEHHGFRLDKGSDVPFAM